MALELKGYQTQGVTPSAGGVAPTMAAQASQVANQSLANRLSEFTGMAQQAAKAQAQDKAVEDAARDSAEGKPFYKESVYTAYGQAYNSAASATYAANANIETQRKSDELALQHENNPLAYTTAMNSFVEELGKQAPTDSLRATIKISGTKLKNAVFGSLSQQENQRIKAAQKETFLQESQLNIGQIVNLESIGDTAAADLLKKKNLVHMNALEAEGVLTPAESIKYTKQGNFQIRKGTAENNMMGLLQEASLENAATLLENYRTTKSQDLDIDEHEAIYSELNRLYSNEVKNRDAVDKEKKEYANSIIDDANKVMKAGLTFDDIEGAKEAYQFATPAKQKEFDIQMAAKKAMDIYRYKSLPEQEKTLADVQASGMIGANIVDAEVLGAIETNLKERKAKAAKDPISLGVAEGRFPPSQAMSVSNGIQAIIDIMPERMRMRSANMLEYGDEANKVFTDAEASQWSAYLENPKTSSEEKIAFIKALPIDAMKPALLQLQKKDAFVLSFVGGLVSEGKEEIAKKVLRGQTILQELKGVVDMETVTWKAYGNIGNAMQFSEIGDRQSLVNSIIAFSAADSEEKGTLNKGWTGADMTKTIKNLTNGVAKRNNQSYFLPDNATENEVEDWLESDALKNTLPEVPGFSKEQVMTIISQGCLVSTGNGTYAVKQKDSKKFLMISDKKPLQLKYPQ